MLGSLSWVSKIGWPIWGQDYGYKTFFFFPYRACLKENIFIFYLYLFLTYCSFLFCVSMNFFWKYKLFSNHQIYHGLLYVTGSILRALYRLPQLTLTVISCVRHCYYLCFRNEVIKVQRHQVTSEATVHC